MRKFRQLIEEFLRVLHHFGGNARILQAHLHVVAADTPGDTTQPSWRESSSKSMSHSQLVSLVKYFRLTASTITSTTQGRFASWRI